MDYLEKYNMWLDSPTFDEETKNELRKIKGDEKEIEERFYKDLEFGTGGMRGIVASGSNRMNKYTITKATQGLANYIIKEGKEDRGVVIAYDSRHMSIEFSIWAALCLNANGIKTYRFESLRPTPELSFALRKLGCVAGIVITASHNPPEYNGYKVYYEDGAQVTSPRDKDIIDEVNKITDFATIKSMDLEEAKEKGLYNEIGKEIDDEYIETLKKYVLNPEIVKEMGDKLKIVYTPLHGTGRKSVQRILKEIGFKNVYTVKEQEMPDGDFPTVSYPNPEDPKAFILALKLAKEVDADVVLANDPDADRLGIYAKDEKTGEYKNFTGNMSAMLIAEYRLSQLKERNEIPKGGAFISTIVSTNMAAAIAKEYNLKLIETLTGFKFIGEKIKEFEETGANTYMFGFEESYGCLIGTYTRDKDGISAVMSLCEAAAYYAKKGITLCEQMENIYKKYGYYKEGQVAITMKGIEGAEKINKVMDNLRNNPISELGGYNVLSVRDYKLGTIKYKDGREGKTDLPKSNVLYFELENNAWCCARPSGTEPKIKFYIGVCEKSEEEATSNLNKMTEELKKLAE
ncbi:MAG: phospho-sugar mutase [Clostridia bacterium]|nr:phospho-sugar mutase [Clostridia bacterium]